MTTQVDLSRCQPSTMFGCMASHGPVISIGGMDGPQHLCDRQSTHTVHRCACGLEWRDA